MGNYKYITEKDFHLVGEPVNAQINSTISYEGIKEYYEMKYEKDFQLSEDELMSFVSSSIIISGYNYTHSITVFEDVLFFICTRYYTGYYTRSRDYTYEIKVIDLNTKTTKQRITTDLTKRFITLNPIRKGNDFFLLCNSFYSTLYRSSYGSYYKLYEKNTDKHIKKFDINSDDTLVLEDQYTIGVGIFDDYKSPYNTDIALKNNSTDFFYIDSYSNNLYKVDYENNSYERHTFIEGSYNGFFFDVNDDYLVTIDYYNILRLYNKNDFSLIKETDISSLEGVVAFKTPIYITDDNIIYVGSLIGDTYRTSFNVPHPYRKWTPCYKLNIDMEVQDVQSLYTMYVDPKSTAYSPDFSIAPFTEDGNITVTTVQFFSNLATLSSKRIFDDGKVTVDVYASRSRIGDGSTGIIVEQINNSVIEYNKTNYVSVSDLPILYGIDTPFYSTDILSYRVAEVNDTPVIGDISNITIPEDGQYTVSLEISDEETPIEELDVTVYGGNLTMDFDKETKLLTIFPVENFFGDSVVRIYVRDKALETDTAVRSVSKYFNVTVSPINDKPIIKDNDFSMDEDSIGVFYINGYSDIENDNLTFELVNDPLNGTVIFDQTIPRKFEFTPLPNFSGIETIQYKAFDGTDYSDIATISITVRNINDAPVFDDNASVDDMEIYQKYSETITVPLASDIDDNFEDLTYKVVGACILTSVDNGDGTVTITVNDKVGLSTCSLRVYDAAGLYDELEFDIEVLRDWDSICKLQRDPNNEEILFIEDVSNIHMDLIPLSTFEVNELSKDETYIDKIYNNRTNIFKNFITDFINIDKEPILNYTKVEIDGTIYAYEMVEENSLFLVEKSNTSNIVFTTDFAFDYEIEEQKFDICKYDKIKVNEYIFNEEKFYEIISLHYTVNGKEVVYYNLTALSEKTNNGYRKRNYGVYEKYNEKLYFHRNF